MAAIATQHYCWPDLSSRRALWKHEIRRRRRGFDEKGANLSLHPHFCLLEPGAHCLRPPSTRPLSGCLVLSLIPSRSIMSMFHISTFKLLALIGLLRGAKACGDDLLHCCFQEHKIIMTCWWRRKLGGRQSENLFEFNTFPASTQWFKVYYGQKNSCRYVHFLFK